MNSPSATTLDNVDILTDRARRLRLLAARLGHLLSMSLPGLAGEDTWRGPRPDLCRTMLLQNNRQIRHRMNELVDIARDLERQAEAVRTTIRLGGL